MRSRNSKRKWVSERNIRLLISYDGTDFCGWQVQKSERTVQGVIESCLQKIHKKKVGIAGAGRTDSGVHAAGQTAHFFTPLASMAPAQFIAALNSLLPWDIRVLDAQATDPDFHSRYDAVQREYRYYIISENSPRPWEGRYAWPLGYTPNLARLERMASLLSGTHDFSAFTLERERKKNTIRSIDSAGFLFHRGKLEFRIRGKSFLWRMVRMLVGTMINLEKRGFDGEAFKSILFGEDTLLPHPVIPAPAKGLFLHKVTYPG